MTRKYEFNRCLQFALAGLLGWLSISIFTPKTQAQQSNIVPDNTLGREMVAISTSNLPLLH
ncbi:MAG: hypothetical protein RMY28_020235 [Nostoc sp. ChiSLP01]